MQSTQSTQIISTVHVNLRFRETLIGYLRPISTHENISIGYRTGSEQN